MKYVSGNPGVPGSYKQALTNELALDVSFKYYWNSWVDKNKLWE